MITINWKRYLIFGGISSAICFAFSKGLNDVYGIGISLIATLLNQYFLILGANEFIRGAKYVASDKNSGTPMNKKKVFLLFLLKFGILFFRNLCCL